MALLKIDQRQAKEKATKPVGSHCNKIGGDGIVAWDGALAVEVGKHSEIWDIF